MLKDLPHPERITERTVAESTKLYDRTGQVLLYEVHGEEKRTVIPFQEIPSQVKNATLAAEDINFYSHSGLDFRGILRAVLANLKSGSLSQGGSTITQQLIKGTLLGPEKTFRRKIREWILALLLEKQYGKNDILAMYLNQIPYGSNAYGIGSAAQTYFNKKAVDLNLIEAVTLAALPKAPTYFSPYGSHKDELIKRSRWILDRMMEANFITKEEKETALNTPLIFQSPKQAMRAPHFVMFVKEYLEQKYGQEMVERGGLNVITTLDWKLQTEAEKIIKEGVEANRTSVKGYNAALVAIDPKTGQLLSMVGSQDYWADPLPKGCSPGVNCLFDPQVNTANRLRQPGSAFKPFVYATAFKKGYTPETILFDTFTEFNPNCPSDGSLEKDPKGPGDCYHPRDYDLKTRGPVSLKQSLAQSLNIPSVKLLYLAGINDSIKTAADLGITSLKDPERYGLSLVLGGAEVTLLEMTSAFGVFSQEGILHTKTPILKIENSKKEVLEEYIDYSFPVLDTEVARNINNILSDNDARVPVFSPRSSLYFPDRQVAVKTGTTQDSRDGWVVGYTPSLTVGVWSGNNNNQSMTSLSVIIAGPMWHKFMEFALKDTPKESFTPPEKNLSEKPALRGIYRDGPITKIDKISGKIATEFTPPDLIEETSFGKIKSILAYINKSDPQGLPPSNPFNDAQYKNWQESIDRWLNTNYLIQKKEPIGFDDLHSPDKKPKISFTNLSNNIQSSENLVRIVLNISSIYPIKELSLFINNELYDSKTSVPAGNNYFPLKNKLAPGDYIFKGVVMTQLVMKMLKKKI